MALNIFIFVEEGNEVGLTIIMLDRNKAACLWFRFVLEWIQEGNHQRLTERWEKKTTWHCSLHFYTTLTKPTISSWNKFFFSFSFLLGWKQLWYHYSFMQNERNICHLHKVHLEYAIFLLKKIYTDSKIPQILWKVFALVCYLFSIELLKKKKKNIPSHSPSNWRKIFI